MLVHQESYTKEKPSEIPYTTFTILPFHQKKSQTEWSSSTFKSTTLDETIRYALKWFILT